MPEPIDPKLLDEIRHRLPHWEEKGKTGLTDSIRALLTEVKHWRTRFDQLRADLEAAELEVETRGETIDRLRAEVERPPEGLHAEIKQLRADNETLTRQHKDDLQVIKMLNQRNDFNEGAADGARAEIERLGGLVKYWQMRFNRLEEEL